MTDPGLPVKDNKKIINAWATYDLANSVYNLVITATIFPIYYKIVTTNENAPEGARNIVSFLGMELKNTTLYDYAIAFAYLIIVSIAPLLSGIADYSGKKKRFMQFFCYLGAASCSLMYFFDKDNLGLGIVLAILACIGFSGSLVFYNAYLPEIASPGKQDSVSARGFAMGYVGSSVLLIVNLVMVTSVPKEQAAEMMQYSFLTVGLWWFGFSFIPFYFLPNTPVSHDVRGNPLSKGYMELRKVWKELRKNPRLTRFLLAFFVYSMGVQTVMLVANHFGSEEIRMESGQLITTILIIQFVAMAGSFLFSWLSSKLGNIFALKSATVIWALICFVTFFFVITPAHFMVVAGFVGLVMGGIQALSRSTYSKFLPETEDHASYFSFYDVCEKLSIVFGMGLFGFINELSSGMRQPIIVLISFFVIGFLLLLRIPKSNPS